MSHGHPLANRSWFSIANGPTNPESIISSFGCLTPYFVVRSPMFMVDRGLQYHHKSLLYSAYLIFMLQSLSVVVKLPFVCLNSAFEFPNYLAHKLRLASPSPFLTKAQFDGFLRQGSLANVTRGANIPKRLQIRGSVNDHMMCMCVYYMHAWYMQCPLYIYTHGLVGLAWNGKFACAESITHLPTMDIHGLQGATSTATMGTYQISQVTALSQNSCQFGLSRPRFGRFTRLRPSYVFVW